jgi:putative membrane protein
MIIRPRPSVWRLFFILKGSVLPRIWPHMLGVALIALTVVAAERAGWLNVTPVAALPFTLIGIALSIFLGFRNTASYDRWWEARKILGQVVIDARSLARQAIAYLPEADAQRFGREVIAFSYALKHYLRDTDPRADLARFIGADSAAVAGARNPPNVLLDGLGVRVAAHVQAGAVTDRIAQMMEERVVSLSGDLAACERIKGTPLPFAYTLLLHRTAYVFCWLLPFGLAAQMGLWTPVLAAIVSYTFFGLDALGDELEQPFSAEQNGLPLDSIAQTIEISIRESLGETDLPAPLQPVDHRLT